MMRGVLAAGLIAGAGMLAGCTPPAAPGGAAGPGVPPPSDACGASKLQALVGQPLGALDVKTLPSAPRQIGPDMAVTADYRPDRLNIEYDTANRITKVSCY